MEENKNIKTKLTDENSISWRDVLGGKILTKPQVSKQFKAVLLVFVLCLVYVGNSSQIESQVLKMEEKKKELKFEKMEFYKTKKKKIEEMSQENITEKLNRNQINLKISDKPQYSY
ncbi:hypothetical protein FACS18945_4620 [Bacteroidia bacterium]|nr:hypothetical protein FACS18945_4620 [Bacteroidia bacterium]